MNNTSKFSKDHSYKSAILTSVFAIIGIVIGNCLFQYNSDRSYYLKHSLELKEESYSKLSGINLSLIQSMSNYIGHNILSNYYYARYHKISKSKSDYEKAILEKEKGEHAFPELSKEIRELHEILAKVRIAFRNNNDLDIKVNSLINTGAIVALDTWLDNDINTDLGLNDLLQQSKKDFDSIYNVKYGDPIKNILPILLEEIKKEK